MTVVDGFRLVSNSEVQTFKQCRRRWYLGWYVGLAVRKKEVLGVRSTGTRLHLALETRYQAGKLGSASEVLDTLRTAQREDLERFDGDRDALMSSFDLENAMITGYLEWLAETGEDSHLEVVDSEVYLEAPIPGVGDAVGGLLPVKAIGKLDTRLIDVRTGRRKFMDHKSVISFKVPMIRQNQQILHYRLLEFLTLESADQRCDAAYYNMLRRVKRGPKSKPPYFMRLEIEHNQHEIDNYMLHLVGTVDDMQRVEARLNEGDPKLIPLLVPPTPHRDCDWKCEFQKVCPLFDDGSRVENALEDKYEKIDPLSYYQGKEREVREE